MEYGYLMDNKHGYNYRHILNQNPKMALLLHAGYPLNIHILY